MSKITAGELLTLTIKNQTITVKVEDASKSEYILAKVEKSSSPDYQQGQVCQFDRQLLKNSD